MDERQWQRFKEDMGKAGKWLESLPPKEKEKVIGKEFKDLLRIIWDLSKKSKGREGWRNVKNAALYFAQHVVAI